MKQLGVCGGVNEYIDVDGIGGLFDFHEGVDPMAEVAFRYSIERVNANRNVLPRSRLVSNIERLPSNDSHYASKKGEILFTK